MLNIKDLLNAIAATYKTLQDDFEESPKATLMAIGVMVAISTFITTIGLVIYSEFTKRETPRLVIPQSDPKLHIWDQYGTGSETKDTKPINPN